MYVDKLSFTLAGLRNASLMSTSARHFVRKRCVLLLYQALGGGGGGSVKIKNNQSMMLWLERPIIPIPFEIVSHYYFLSG